MNAPASRRILAVLPTPAMNSSFSQLGKTPGQVDAVDSVLDGTRVSLTSGPPVAMPGRSSGHPE